MSIVCPHCQNADETLVDSWLPNIREDDWLPKPFTHYCTPCWVNPSNRGPNRGHRAPQFWAFIVDAAGKVSKAMPVQSACSTYYSRDKP